MAIEDRNLTVGTRLVASYRKQAHACMVEKAEEGDGKVFVLEAVGSSRAHRRQRVRSWAARKEGRSLKRRPQSQRGSSTASRTRRG